MAGGFAEHPGDFDCAIWDADEEKFLLLDTNFEKFGFVTMNQKLSSSNKRLSTESPVFVMQDIGKDFIFRCQSDIRKLRDQALPCRRWSQDLSVLDHKETMSGLEIVSISTKVGTGIFGFNMRSGTFY